MTHTLEEILLKNSRKIVFIFLSLSLIHCKPFLKENENHFQDLHTINHLLYAEDVEDFEQDPEVSPGLFEGDIAGPNPEVFVRLGLNWKVFQDRKWANGTVPFEISSEYLPEERRVIETAISTLMFFTCIKFIPYDGTQEDYLTFSPVKKPKGCWSFVGKMGGQQLISLQKPDSRSSKCLGSLGKPIHEILHALGIFHEQARADRDEHVTIIINNIDPGRLYNFRKLNEGNTSYFFPYDYDSVMHYGAYYFSKNRYYPTMVPKKQGARIGQRFMMSKGDCLKINALYGCFKKDSFITDKYKAFCNYLAY